jgi:polysaccharide export outer membrane protein
MPMDGPPPLPRELAKSVMPPYTLEPPDTIYIDVVRAIPKPPYRVEPLDVLVVNVAETLPNQPINGTFLVSPDGLINLGYAYGVVRVAGLTLEQSAAAIKLILRSKLNDPQVGVGLAQFRGTATLKGEFMLAQDGTVTLGTYGCVQLAGLTVNQAKAMIENHLSKWLMNPEVSVTVTGYNSKVYYIITDGAGFGQQVYRFPITGNETVLDALAQANGLSAVSSKRRIWLARPAPACKGCYQILPIHWEVITQAGATETNWQLFPGDRIFIGADPWIEWDNKIAKIFAPIERMLGITLLGTATVNTFRGFNNGNGGGTTFIPVGGF